MRKEVSPVNQSPGLLMVSLLVSGFLALARHMEDCCAQCVYAGGGSWPAQLSFDGGCGNCLRRVMVVRRVSDKDFA